MKRRRDYLGWDAYPYFEKIVSENKICRTNNYQLCRVSSLQGFEDALNKFQSGKAFVCVADESDAKLCLNNTGHSKFIKTVFLAKRHPANDMAKRDEAFKELRTLGRQLLSRFLKEKQRIDLGFLYIDNEVNFSEIPQAFFNGCACLYFNIMVGVYVDLSYNEAEWIKD